jgi:hypothetical protein
MVLGVLSIFQFPVLTCARCWCRSNGIGCLDHHSELEAINAACVLCQEGKASSSTNAKRPQLENAQHAGEPSHHSLTQLLNCAGFHELGRELVESMVGTYVTFVSVNL